MSQSILGRDIPGLKKVMILPSDIRATVPSESGSSGPVRNRRSMVSSLLGALLTLDVLSREKKQHEVRYKNKDSKRTFHRLSRNCVQLLSSSQNTNNPVGLRYHPHHSHHSRRTFHQPRLRNTPITSGRPAVSVGAM